MTALEVLRLALQLALILWERRHDEELSTQHKKLVSEGKHDEAARMWLDHLNRK